MDAATASRSVLIVGAGATGRGHLGQLAFESGYHIAFLDRNRSLCELLRSRGRYTVRLVSSQERTAEVAGFEVFHTGEIDALYPFFRSASLVLTAVCPENVPEAADELRPLFVRWLKESGGKGVKNVLCCENMSQGTTAFRRRLEEGFPGDLLPALERCVGFPDSMIARVVTRPRDPLALHGEEYSEWTADRLALRGDASPAVKTLELVEGQGRYLQRKLYIHNTGHATFGYLGWLRGYTFVHEAARDAEIMEICERAIEESGWAIEREHGFPAEVIRAYRKALTDKCVLSELPDELARVVRDPLRKLGPEERFFGPVGLMLRHGGEPRYLLYGIAAALACRIPGDAQSAELERLLNEGGVAAALCRSGAAVPGGVERAIEALLPEVCRRFAPRRGGPRGPA